MMEGIWDKCPKNEDVLRIEEQVRDFLSEFRLDRYFSLELIEEWIYHCPAGAEDAIFNLILEKMPPGNLGTLSRFDALFRKHLFAHVPQKMLSGLSPVKYTLKLKQISEG
jgi:hypothetical protein